MKIGENIFLAPYTTFKIGGKAKFFIEAKHIDDVKDGIKFAEQKGLPFFILGGGSNILISDKGFCGLVIRVSIRGIQRDKNILQIGAGHNWDNVVAYAVRENLSGIENLSLIPGTIGGAVFQNIGAYGAELSDVITSVVALNTTTGKIEKRSHKEGRFGYRKSIFQEHSGELVILKATIKLSPKFKPNLSYHDIKEYFHNRAVTLSTIRKAVISIRRAKLPYPDTIANAGSFFKNPIISNARGITLIKKHPELKQKKAKGGIKLSAGQLIELTKWKGRRIDNVGVSDKHSLVLVNYNNGTAEEIVNLARKIQNSVLRRFSVRLEPEVVILNYKPSRIATGTVIF